MRYYSRTHLGLIRKNNEDAMLTESPKLFAVADGVGGLNAGEIASRTALDLLKDKCFKLLQVEKNPAYVLRKAVSYVNEQIYQMAHSKPEYAGMGTTLTAVYFETSNIAHIMQIGDSRLYLWRGGKLKQITRDQTLVGELVAAGKITEQESKKHPQKNWLLQAVGVENIIQAEFLRLELMPKDKLLLCSDGLSNMLSDEELTQGMWSEDIQTCGETLLQKALENGGKDNITLIIIDGFTEEEAHGRSH